MKLGDSLENRLTQSIFVQPGVPYDNTLLNNLRSDLQN